MRRLGVLRPIQSIEEVQASIDTFGDRIADGMDARRVPPDDGGGPRFSYRDVVDDLGQNLEPMRQKVVAAEDEHVRRLAHAAALRRQGEELGTELYDQQVMARRILGGAYPKRGFELAAVSGTTPRNYKPLQEQVDQTVKLLREPVAELPPVKLSGVEITPVEVADGLQLTLQGFRTHRAEHARAQKAVGESQVDLDRTLDEFRATFPWIARTFEGFARLAGSYQSTDVSAGRAGLHGAGDRPANDLRRPGLLDAREGSAELAEPQPQARHAQAAPHQEPEPGRQR